MYGTAKLHREPDKRELQERRSCGDLLAGPDWPVLLLLWLFFGMPLVTFGTGGPLFLCILAVLHGLFFSVVLGYFAVGRGELWMYFSGLCGFSAVFGMVLGLLLRVEDHTTDEFARSVGMVILLLVLYLLVVLALSRALPTLGCALIGSSAGFAEKHGWGWNPRAAASMQFGCDCRSLAEVVAKTREFPEQVVLDLLRHRCYWSGELAFDYAFHLANEHSFIGVLCAHPASAYEKYERGLVLAFVCILIIFPTAAFTVAVHNAACRGIITLILVTAPRNLLRLYIKRIVIADDEILLKEQQEGQAVQEDPVPTLQPPEVVRPAERAERAASGRWKVAARALLSSETSGERTPANLRDMWRQAASKVRAANAFWWEVTFFSVGFVVLGLIMLLTCLYVKAHSALPLNVVLSEAAVGLGWAFVLELIFDLLISHRSSDKRIGVEENWFMGFLHRWCKERDEYIKRSTS